MYANIAKFPNITKAIAVTALLPLPWDKAGEAKAEAPRLSREEAYEQFKALTSRHS